LAVLLMGCCDIVPEPEYQCEDGSYVYDPSHCDEYHEYDYVVADAEPYISEIVFEDITLRGIATGIADDCPSGSKECHINAVYRHVVENYDYYSDPRAAEFIQSPSETMAVKGGDCEDLTILMNSLLENLGVKTYVVLTPDHAYSLACGVNTSELWNYADESLAEQIKEDWGESRDERSFVVEPYYYYYFGGNGTSFEGSDIDYLDISYTVESSQPLELYVVPTPTEYDLMVNGQQYVHYPSCQQNKILKYTGSCEKLRNYALLCCITEMMSRHLWT